MGELLPFRKPKHRRPYHPDLIRSFRRTLDHAIRRGAVWTRKVTEGQALWHSEYSPLVRELFLARFSAEELADIFGVRRMVTIKAKIHSKTELESHPNDKLVYLQVSNDNTFGVRLPIADADQFRVGDVVMITVEKAQP